MTYLSAPEFRKRANRPAIMIRKLKEKEPFEVRGGKKVKLVYVKGIEKVLEKGSSTDLNKLLFADGKGNVYKLSDIVKNADFGGRGEGSGTTIEDATLADLQKQMMAAMKKDGRPYLNIVINSRIYKAADVISTALSKEKVGSRGSPKSDFHLVDVDGKEIAWFSHKAGSKPNDFQQWGGVSESHEPKIYATREVQAFSKTCQGLFPPPEGIPKGRTVARLIKDRQLRMMAVYGNAFGGPLGQQNITMLLQGPIKLMKSGRNYKLEANNTHVNGEEMHDGFVPVLEAIYKGDRSDLGIKGARVVITALGGRKISYMV